MTQIRDLGKEYDLGIEVKSIVEVVSASIDWKARTQALPDAPNTSKKCLQRSRNAVRDAPPILK